MTATHIEKKAYQSVKIVMVEPFFRLTLSIGKVQLVLGRWVQCVAGVTFHSLSAIVGIVRPRLSRLLKKKFGEIPAGASEIESGNMVFEAEKTVPLVRAVKTAVVILPKNSGVQK